MLKPRARLRGFYAILDVSPDEARDPAAVEARAQRLLAARPCTLQLRAKQTDVAALRALAARLLAVCRPAAVPFCVNDRIDVALAVGADFVHLGQDDLSLGDARRVRERAGARELIIGVSTHNRAQALAADDGGADYIGFGPIFDTASKLDPDPTVGLRALAEVCAVVAIPVVAIGGITLETVGAVVEAGAAAAALIGAVDRAPDPAAAGRAVAAAFGSG